MTTYDTTEVEGTDVEPRTRRAVTECMAVDAYAYGEGSGMFDVYSASGNTYTVSLRDPLGCTCPDFQQRGDQLGDSGCKHVRRVRLALGIDPIPDALEDDVEGTLATNREKFTPDADTESEDVEPEPTDTAGEHAVATDGGVVLEEPESEDDEDGDGDGDGRPADRDVRLEANRIATEAVANADGPLADFDVFCLTVEATQDTLLRALEE